MQYLFTCLFAILIIPHIIIMLEFVCLPWSEVCSGRVTSLLLLLILPVLYYYCYYGGGLVECCTPVYINNTTTAINTVQWD